MDRPKRNSLLKKGYINDGDNSKYSRRRRPRIFNRFFLVVGKWRSCQTMMKLYMYRIISIYIFLYFSQNGEARPVCQINLPTSYTVGRDYTGVDLLKGSTYRPDVVLMLSLHCCNPPYTIRKSVFFKNICFALCNNLRISSLKHLILSDSTCATKLFHSNERNATKFVISKNLSIVRLMS